ncbi:MAG TPA: VacJ family lipoprotein [Casimicrobiaceae bacterium]|nr:VacJ family lipoprotein [Casimicrobiaceae bacterium]
MSAISVRTSDSASVARQRGLTYARKNPINPARSAPFLLQSCVTGSCLASLRWPAALAACVALSGCATLAADRAPPDDPLEPLNRAVFDVNSALDKALIKPAAEAYRQIVPQFARDRIRSAIDNLTEPRIFANDLLQGRADAAGITLGRFVINTTAGLAGMFDPATQQGLPKQSGDFGQTLYAWGLSDGPYLVLLFFGPSNLRDAVGLGVDLFTTPPGVFVPGHAGVVTGLVVGTVDGMDLRSRNIENLDEIIASAVDYYARLKSIAQQRRQVQLREARGLAPGEPQELIDPGTSGDEFPR